MEERNQIVEKCCCCVNLKVGAVIIVLVHFLPYMNTVYVLQKSNAALFYVSSVLLTIYVIVTILYFVAIFCWEKSILQIPLLVLYVLTTILNNVLKAFPEGRNKNAPLIMEVAIALLVLALNVYFFIVLYSLYVKMWNEENDF